MAPWPVQGSEPKVIDKDDKRDSSEVIPKQEINDSAEIAIGGGGDQAPKQLEEKEVLTLDEGQLKALLDEAITYKNPKDREGKSELFKELLQKVEADEGENKGLGSSLTSKLPKTYCNLPARRKVSRLQGRECGVGVSSTRGGSLQNLNALGMESSSRTGRNRRSGRCGDTLVSARQREGGSLPTNVNVDNDPDLDSIYTSRATLEVSGSGNEEKINIDEANVSTFIQSTLPNGSDVPINYTMFCPVSKEEVENKIDDPVLSSCITVAPLPIDFDNVFTRTNTVQQHISRLSLAPSQINNASSEEHREADISEHKKLSTSKRIKKSSTSPKCEEHLEPHLFGHPPGAGLGLDMTRERFLGLPLTSQWNHYSSCLFFNYRELTSRWAALISKDPDSKTKSLDENGNALNNVRVEGNCLDRKKQRKVKTKNDRNSRDFLAEDVEGFRGGADIETLMEYIESPSNILEGSKAKVRPNQINGPRNHVKVRAKEEDSRPIKRRTKEKLKRYNSLEEISKTKLEDLTEEGSSERVNGPSLTVKKKQVTLDDAQLGKKSSWDEESFLEDTSMIQRNLDCKPGKGSQEGMQDSEFHLVTKKHRKKKRRSGSSRVRSRPPVFSRDFPAHDRTLERSDASGLLYQYRHVRGDKSCSQPRRKSASSVPPSDKSDSSDLDSVHSLPVSSSTSRTKVGKNSVSGDSTPQASYADIARTTPPDIGSQSNVYSRGNVSHYLSCAGPDFEMMSTNRIPNVMLPASFASCSFKKDAMTDTTCDNIKPALMYEEYPPLGIKSTELFIEKTVKRSCSARDNIPEGKMNLKTVPLNKNVIPVNKNEDVPLVVPSPYVKSSSVSNPNCKRPPVILMDEPTVNSEIPTELTFGFEVNQQLLQCEVPMCNINNDTLTSNEASATPVSSSPPTSVRDDSLNRLVQYHILAWDGITKDLRTGRAVYYNGQ